MAHVGNPGRCLSQRKCTEGSLSHCCSSLRRVHSLWSHGLQHARLPCPSLSLRDCYNSCSLSRSNAIEASHPLMTPSRPALNLSQHQGLFQWVGSSHQAAEVLELQLCPRSSSKRTIHTKVWVDLVFDGNGTPLQYSCLENPMDGGAWQIMAIKPQLWESLFPPEIIFWEIIQKVKKSI